MTIIHGYAFRFNEIVTPQGGPKRLLVKPGAFILPGDPGGEYAVDLFMSSHFSEPGKVAVYGKDKGAPGLKIGSTADGSLRFEQNANGLYFEWSPGPELAAQRALEAVAEWRMNGACIGFPRAPYRSSRIETINGEPVEVIDRTFMGMLLLTVAGCCPATGCKVMTGPRLAGDVDLCGEHRQLVATAEAA